jgi:hypothetical protein
MEIARLFYQTYGDKELGDIVRLLASFKNEEKQTVAAPTAPKVVPFKRN